ncbi:MAG: hydroxylamine oxidoreductase [Candidatus Aminicenantes bacterium]|nr:hydroxylamine oxidoreductase [Candidatus Aminicenantes bacterium]
MNYKKLTLFIWVFVFLLLSAWSSQASDFSAASDKCITCHKKTNRALFKEWSRSKHHDGGIGCYECHQAKAKAKGAFLHQGKHIKIIVSPKDCAECHEQEVKEFSDSHHARGSRIIGSLDNWLAEVVEGNRAYKTIGSPHGESAAAVNGCWQCHGSQVKVLEKGKLDPATWPNSGIGRLNPDGSEGSCSACHGRHLFSAAVARNPENCGKCHMGPDHPQLEIYNESKHGIAFRANIDRMNLNSSKWVVGEDYSAAPTCATCHMSAVKGLPLTHDIGLRISWNNRPVISVRPEVADAKMNLPGKDIPWQTRRKNMQKVCSSCHSRSFAVNFYSQYDALIDLYHEKYAKPGLALMKLAAPLLFPVKFANKIDFVWFELWHHEGRRARHGASMMGPDITHWHGTYELARNFYSEFIPEIKHLIADHRGGAKAKEAGNLEKKLQEILNNTDHRWFLGKMDAAEKERRKKRLKEFKAKQ